MDDVFSKLSIIKFDLNHFMQKYNFNKDESSEYNDYSDFNLQLLEGIDAVLIEDIFIKDEYKGNGYGVKLINELKQQGKPVILYSTWDAVDFWSKQGFDNSKFDGEYIFTWGL